MNTDKNKEFLKLKAWGETILPFLKISTDVSKIDTHTMLIDIFNECLKKGRLSSMRIFIHELNEIALAQTEYTGQLCALNRILMDKFGEDLSSRLARSMAGVLTRGKIRNDEEFVRVNEWIDHLLYDKDNPDADQHIEQYNRMLRDYEEKAARRLRKSNP